MSALRAERGRPLWLLGLALVLGSCKGPVPEDSADWRGTVTTDGPTRTVVNESGSVWGGVATLRERASIGLADGEDAYLFGTLGGIWSDGEEIFVLDAQAPALRAYDWQGRYLRDIGRPGEGPGELSRPLFLDGDTQGRVVVANCGTRRIAVYAKSGEHLADWPMGSVECFSHPMVVGDDGRVYLSLLELEPATGIPWKVMQGHGPEGPVGEPIYPPEREFPRHLMLFNGSTEYAPYAPRIVWSPARDLTVIGGASHEYRFEIVTPGGDRTVVHRQAESFPLEGEQRDWRRRLSIASGRRGIDPTWTWDGAEMPSTKPYFSHFLPTESGEIWVIRPGAPIPLECDPDASLDNFRTFWEQPCFRDDMIVDVFGRDGRFRGEVDIPDGVNLESAYPWVDGETVIANVDDDGVIRVVRYEIVWPSNTTGGEAPHG